MVILLLCVAALYERWHEAQDYERFTPGQTFADVNSGHIRYRLTDANLQGPLVVFLSGVAGAAEQWGAVQASLAGSLPTLSYDRAGYGFSDSSAHDAQQQAQELAELLAAVHGSGPVILVAYSMSASVARLFAAGHGSQVTGIALVEPSLTETDQRVPHRHSPLRAYWRWFLHDSVCSLFGLDRVPALHIKRPESMALPQDEDRADAALSRFSHWFAADRELLSSSASAREMSASTGAGNAPITFLLGEQVGPQTEPNRIYDIIVHELLSKSRHGELRSLGAAIHTKLLTDPSSAQLITRAIQDIAALPSP